MSGMGRAEIPELGPLEDALVDVAAGPVPRVVRPVLRAALEGGDHVPADRPDVHQPFTAPWCASLWPCLPTRTSIRPWTSRRPVAKVCTIGSGLVPPSSHMQRPCSRQLSARLLRALARFSWDVRTRSSSLSSIRRPSPFCCPEPGAGRSSAGRCPSRRPRTVWILGTQVRTNPKRRAGRRRQGRPSPNTRCIVMNFSAAQSCRQAEVWPRPEAVLTWTPATALSSLTVQNGGVAPGQTRGQGAGHG